MASTCDKCGRLFIPNPGTKGETQCFECWPRTVTVALDIRDISATHRSRRRRNRSARREGRADAVEKMQYGAGLVVVGGAITFCSYAFAGITGGWFILAWGPLVFGSIRLVLGIIQYFGG